MYLDRTDAGRALARRLAAYGGRADVLVLALPRGGVPVAYELARELRAPLDAFLVRKLGVPWQPELAMGAVASGGITFVNQEVVRTCGVTDVQMAAVLREESQLLAERERAYRGHNPPPQVEGKIVILVDDGLATGSSMRAAIAALRPQRPARIVVAVPVAAEATCEQMRGEVDEMVCGATPEPFWAVGQWYADFSPVSDEEVRDLLQRAASQFRAVA